MAEAVGLAASGIAIGTLAAQIANSVIKLKSFYDQIQDAPEDLRHLIEELEILSDVIADIEDDQQQNPVSSLLLDSVSSSKCLQFCKRGADQLKELTNQLSGEIETRKSVRRKWASGKIVLKKDGIDKYRARLERAVRLLTLSQQVYTRTLVKYQPDIIIAKLSQQKACLGSSTLESSGSFFSREPYLWDRNGPPSESTVITKQALRNISNPWLFSTPIGTIAYTKRHYRKTIRHDASASFDTEEREETIIDIRGPSWLINRAWRIQAIKDRSGWTFCPRTYNDIPSGSLVFKLIRNDDLKALQQLFNDRGASPFDRDEHGFTILHIAAWNGRYRMIKPLIDLGADPNCITNDGLKVYPRMLCLLNFFYEEPSSDRTNEILNSMRLLLLDTESEPHPHFPYVSKETFSFWQPIFEPHHYIKSVEERFQQLAAVASTRLYYGSEALRIALDENSSLTPMSVRLADDRGVTLLYVAAVGIGSILSCLRSQLGSPRALQLRLLEWRRFVVELITLGSDLHPVATDKTTPLCKLISGYIYYYPTDGHYSIKVVLRTWIEGLQEAGVDLVIYGQTEVELHERGLVDWTFPIYKNCSQYHLAQFFWGPSPADWDAEIKEVDEGYEIPGAWVEEDGDESDVGEEIGSEDPLKGEGGSEDISGEDEEEQVLDENEQSEEEGYESENGQGEEGAEQPEQDFRKYANS